MQRKNTKQRELLLCYMRENAERHITAAELLHALAENGTPVGAATVYRQLERLEEEGLVRRYCLDDRGSACYQFTGDADAGCESHFHLKCTVCGKLFHLACGHLSEIAAHVAAEHGFQIDPSRTVFYGICEHCGAEGEKQV